MAGRKKYVDENGVTRGGGNDKPARGFQKSGVARAAQKKSTEARVKNARLRNALVDEFDQGEVALAQILAGIVKTGKIKINGNHEVLDPKLYVEVLKECLAYVQAKPRAVAEKISDDGHDGDGKALNQQFIINMPNTEPKEVEAEEVETEDEPK